MSDPNTVEILAREQRTRRLKMGYNVSQLNGRRVAAIRVSGQYLESLGFVHDGYMDLTINDDKSITIRPISKEQHDREKAERAGKP